ncbi:type II toxin-antitoxin system HicB family antitoxin [Paucilactobacillus nenjiangensis]|uniref:type II toxin-antitoxin system HicB family antitoxin n=1 Tax=Paucilactobacillus nenjiangensis TaxID=1296540 RepID=UPI0010F6B84D|nr:type II toxin-antitoxin system HicB family antitoxin [Paucilactobacillus nenjiangensis]
MLASYPALFYSSIGIDEPAEYFIHFPDFKNSATQGDDIHDALIMASDWLGMNLVDYVANGGALPQPSDINQLSLFNNNPFKNDPDFNLKYIPKESFISMVNVNLADYLELDEPIEKKGTIPKWADERATSLHLDLGETLVDSILEKEIR